MARHIHAVTLVVPDYDSALDFYVGTLGFSLVKDIPLEDGKRWVIITPEVTNDTATAGHLLLARAVSDTQKHAIGNQTGGRVGFFLVTNDFYRDHVDMLAKGVRFEEPPRHETYGIVAVWQDPFGNRWDLIEWA